MTATAAPSVRELTLRVVLLGILLSVVMGAANVYVGLKVGMTVSASIPAAAVSMLIFRTFFKSRSILEANQVQTCASAGESLAAGIIFTMPALLMMGIWADFDFWTVTAVGFTGGLLGILFMIPMRRVFVKESPELPYPEGIACAAVLEAGTREDADPAGARALIAGGVLGSVFIFVAGYLQLFHEKLEVATERASRIFYYGSDISPMLVAVGLIVRLNVALLIFIGGALSWIIGIPLLGLEGVTGLDADGHVLDAVATASGLWSSKMRFVGVGAMVVGGIGSIFAVRHGLLQAVHEMKRGLLGRGEVEARDRDLPPQVILGLSVLCVLLVAGIYYNFTHSVAITGLTTVVMIVMSFFFAAVASYIVGLVGNTNSPVSGMTITAVLFTGAMLWVFGYTGPEGAVAIIGVAAIVCCVACTAGDVCNDLKTGDIVGAAPYRQQIMQILGVGVAAFVMAPIMSLLHKAEEATGGIGGSALPAPQAGLFKSLAEGFSGQGDLPGTMLAIGAGVGVVILILDGMLKARKSSFRLYLMPVAVGMYLPFYVGTPILLGGLIAHFATRGITARDEQDKRLHKGVLFSSGVIAGEALTKIVLAGLAVGGAHKLGWSEWLDEATGMAWASTALTLVAAAFVVVAFFRVSTQRARR